ncbi:hypothetical protein P154DRAFT_523942 [Amniculicola lignicola CBS 123094]|uniref:YDG domain-containing protein n=1 Tax=Amniculicola lignicola CBS 123094 TaxID=1392246 RepID=A0A6A5WEU4_9PLEO|nr:hypothetical protein P154DRAFT_523942 [Amniculicola lignicola CBS 123094]
MLNPQAQKRPPEGAGAANKRSKYGFTTAEVSKLSALDDGHALTEWRKTMMQYVRDEEEERQKKTEEAEERQTTEDQLAAERQAGEQRARLQMAQEKQVAHVRTEKETLSPVAKRAQPKEKVTSHGLSEKRRGKRPQMTEDVQSPVTEDPTSLFLPKNGPPEWYIKANFSKAEAKKLNSSQPVKAMEALKDCLRRCLNTKTAKVFDELRDHVHKAEFLNMTAFALKKTFVFDTPDTPKDDLKGLRRIFGDDIFPWDLQEDAKQLYIRWWYARLEPNLLRGLRKSRITHKEGWRNNDSIDPDYKKPTAKYHGQGNLVMGQWWPTQLCTVRDGAHGSAQGGIFGEKEAGGYSIVLSGGAGYEDEDHGDWILYSGTEGKDMVVSEATTRLIESCDATNKPVRVIRSMNLKKPNKYRPEVGYRYDGLYEVVSYELRNKFKATYRFRLERCPGQNPIRYKGKEARPTYWEKEEYAKLKLDAKFSGM